MDNDILFRVTGLSAATSEAVAAIGAMGYDGLDAAMAQNRVLIPADNNRMAVFLTTEILSDADRTTISHFRKAGVLTILLSAVDQESTADARAILPAEGFPTAIRILADIIFKAGHINLDFNDLYTALHDRGPIRFFEATGCCGDDPAQEAVENLKAAVNPDLAAKAGAMLLNIYYNPATTFKAAQAHAISRFITGFSQEADIMWGLAFDDSLPVGSVRITLIMA